MSILRFGCFIYFTYLCFTQKKDIMNQFANKWEQALIKAKACKNQLNKLLNAETDIESVKVVINNLNWSMNNLPEMLKDGIRLYPDSIKADDWYAVRYAASNGHLDTLKYMHSFTDISDGIKAIDWFAVRNAAFNYNLDTIKYLHSIMDISDGLKADNWYVVRRANTETKQWLDDTFPELIKEYPY